jgi:WD40 repeat protein
MSNGSSKSRIRKLVCISTSRPTDSISTSGGGGSLSVVCPYTGSIHSSLRVSADMAGKLTVGISSVSFFPSSFSPKDSLALAFGASTKKDDSYAMLVTLRQASMSPTLHWKSRLPEALLSAGLLVSTCGNYIVGGGASGNVYVWKSLGGLLLATFKAHYRSVTCMAWSSCGRILVSGGADGIVHAFSLQSMVAMGANESSIQPIRSFSHHQLPVTSICSLPSGRMVSGSQDGQVVIMELYSDQCLASIQLPHPVTSLDATAHRLFVGTHQGTVYCIDLDQYALHQTQHQGAVVVRRDADKTKPFSETVLGDSDTEGDGASSYQVELRGHDRPVTALAVISDYEEEWLVTGDQSGTVRVWDMASRACIRTIHLWSQSGGGTASTTTSTNAQHPVASITIMEERVDDDNAAETILTQMNKPTSSGRDPSSKNQQSIVNQIKPLGKFADEIDLSAVTLRVDRPKRMFWQEEGNDNFCIRAALEQRRRRLSSPDVGSGVTNERTKQGDDTDREILRLKEALAKAKDELERRDASTSS